MLYIFKIIKFTIPFVSKLLTSKFNKVFNKLKKTLNFVSVFVHNLLLVIIKISNIYSS